MKINSDLLQLLWVPVMCTYNYHDIGVDWSATAYSRNPFFSGPTIYLSTFDVRLYQCTTYHVCAV